MYKHNTNYGSMFKNKSETKADYVGEINVDGVVYFIDGYIKDAINGKYLSLKVKRKDKQPDISQTFDEDIPF